jgi:hypothetical protein
MKLMRILLFLGGAGLLVYGAGFCYNNFNAMKETGADGTTSLSWMAVLFIVLPFFIALAGFFGLLAGIFCRNWMLTWANFLGMKFVFFPLMMLAAAVFCDRSVLAPCYEHLGAWLFGGPFAIDSQAYLRSVLLLALLFQIYQAGINIAEYGVVDLNIVTHVVTRTLFVMIIVPLCFYNEKLVMTDKTMPTVVFAGLSSWYILVFAGLRRMTGSIVGKILMTVLCVPALALYYVLMQFAYKYVGFILDFSVLIPLFLIGFITVMGIGYREDHYTKKFAHSICGWCNREFEGLYEYCSEYCQKEANTPCVVQCAGCGNPLTVLKKNLGGAHYCGSQCYPYKCPRCGHRSITGRTCPYCR